MLLAEIDITRSTQRGINELFAWLPELVGAVLVLIVGYIVAKVVGGVVARVLGRAGLDRSLTTGQGGEWVQRVTASPSRLIGKLAFWAVLLGAISLAVSVLGINALTNFVAAIFAYLPHVIAAVLIFLVASAISAAVAALVSRTMGDTPTGKFVATAAPILVMAIATFMILTELGIAEQIVMITYAALMGAIALGMALAFGLGGREVAARMLADAYAKGQEQRTQVRRDVELGKERGRDQVERGKARFAQDTTEAPPAGATTRRPQR